MIIFFFPDQPECSIFDVGFSLSFFAVWFRIQKKI